MYLRQSGHSWVRGSAVSVLVDVFVEDTDAVGATEVLAVTVGVTEAHGPALAERVPASRAEDAGVRVFAETVVVVDIVAEAVKVVVVVDETLERPVFVGEDENEGRREGMLVREDEAADEAEVVTRRTVPEGETEGAELRKDDDDAASEGLKILVKVGGAEQDVEREDVLVNESEAPIEAEESTDGDTATEKVAPWVTEVIGAVPEFDATAL